MISNLTQRNASLTKINISWNPPTIPNGIITVYEIRYRESTSTGPYNITNTTNTYYSIVGLIPNTSYTIGVRAYTSIGPGEWTNKNVSTSDIIDLGNFNCKFTAIHVHVDLTLFTFIPKINEIRVLYKIIFIRYFIFYLCIIHIPTNTEFLFINRTDIGMCGDWDTL